MDFLVNRKKLFKAYQDNKSSIPVESRLADSNDEEITITYFLDIFEDETRTKKLFEYLSRWLDLVDEQDLPADLSYFINKYCCDKSWAASYCTNQQQNNQNNQQNNQQGGGGSSSYSSCNISSSNIENGTTVSKGVKCSIVGDIQRALQKHCYSLRDDNMFGPVTEGKVKDFQISKGISPANGVVDSETWEELQKSPSSPCPSGRSGGGRRKKRYDDGGTEEEDVQIIDLDLK